jgi:hypothetical protein
MGAHSLLRIYLAWANTQLSRVHLDPNLQSVFGFFVLYLQALQAPQKFDMLRSEAHTFRANIACDTYRCSTLEVCHYQKNLHAYMYSTVCIRTVTNTHTILLKCVCMCVCVCVCVCVHACVCVRIASEMMIVY